MYLKCALFLHSTLSSSSSVSSKSDGRCAVFRGLLFQPAIHPSAAKTGQIHSPLRVTVLWKRSLYSLFWRSFLGTIPNSFFGADVCSLRNGRVGRD